AGGSPRSWRSRRTSDSHRSSASRSCCGSWTGRRGRRPPGRGRMKAEERSHVAEALDRAAQVLARAPAVALVCHVNPDPDAIGSMYGLALFLASRGTEVICSWPNEPLEPPRWIETLSEVPPTVRMG